MVKKTKDNPPRGLIQILDEMTKATHQLAREQRATRLAMRNWIQELVEREPPTIITISPPTVVPSAPSTSEAVREYYERRKEKEKEKP